MEILVSIIKITILYLFIQQQGYLYGGIIFIFLNFSKKFFFNWYLNMEQMRSSDKCFLSTKVLKMFNIMGMIFFENFDTEKIKDLLIERGLKKIKVLRNKLVYKYFNYYWQEVPLELAIDSIKILPALKSKESVLDFANSEISKCIDVLRELPFEIYIIPYGEAADKKGALLIKADHCLSDGLSAISFFCGIADNYSPEIFPLVMQSKQIPLLLKISRLINVLSYSSLESVFNILYCILSFPYYAPQVLYKGLTKSLGNTPFKIKNESAPTYISKFRCSKLFDLKAYNALRRKEDLGISFNELMMGALSICIGKLCAKDPQQYRHLNEIMTLIPIGLKGIPMSSEQIEINNSTNAIYLELGFIDDLKTGKKFLQEKFSKYIKASGVGSAMFSIVKFMLEFMPLEIFQLLIINQFYKNVDFLPTNIPGPREPLYYYGSKVTDIIPVASTSVIKTNVMIFSYINKFRFIVCTDETAKLDRDEFMELIEQTLEEILIS